MRGSGFGLGARAAVHGRARACWGKGTAWGHAWVDGPQRPSAGTCVKTPPRGAHVVLAAARRRWDVSATAKSMRRARTHTRGTRAYQGTSARVRVRAYRILWTVVDMLRVVA